MLELEKTESTMNLILIWTIHVALFIDFTHFQLPFAFTIIHIEAEKNKTKKQQKALGAFITWIDTKWMWEGQGLYSNMYTLNLKQVSNQSRRAVLTKANVWIWSAVECCEWTIEYITCSGTPPPPLYTLHPPDITHMMNAPRPTVFYSSLLVCIIVRK